MDAAERFTEEIINELREAIRLHDGCEVFAVGAIDSSGKVFQISVVARGTETNVPVLRPFAEKGDVVVHNHPSGVLKPSAPDLGIAAQLGNIGIGFYIVDNQVKRLTVVAEPLPPEEKKPLDIASLSALLKPDGEFSRVYPNYEERVSQIGMLERVGEAFNLDRILVAEAGTGVGKSLAYLIPAVFWVAQNRERVVVSTATINLQEQLLEKDIPLARKLLGQEVEVALIKGRGNYLCLNRLAEAMEEATLFEERNEELLAIKEWSLTSTSGSRNDVSFYPSDSVWSEVCSEADSCLNVRCRFREDCFVLKARRAAAKAQLLVVNHHLLFSDTAVRLKGGGYDATAVLPPFHRLIFDEAHNLEKSATSFFSESMSKFSLRKVVSRIHRVKKGRVFGLAKNLERVIGKGKNLERVPELVERINECAESVNIRALDLVMTEKSVGLKDVDPGRLRQSLYDPLRELAGALVDLVNLFEDIFNQASLPPDDEENIEYEIRAQLRRLVSYAELIREFPGYSEKRDRVFWLERFRGHRGEAAVRFVMTPLDISELMREAVLSPYETVVFTSATLRVGENFLYWKTRIGLADFRERSCEEQVFPSPFPYKTNVLVGIPRDLPQPDEAGYETAVKESILDTLSVSEGKGLVLFTSYELLNRVYEHVRDGLKPLGIEVLKQGDDERSRLLSRFNAETSTVLFATDSFWEGVDSPGETLEALILSRLPFRVPSEPITKARMERIEEQGGNSFYELSLPDAVMRFRQGFGRLIRHQTDRGIVLILDSRIVKKSYGRFFLQALPETEVAVGDRKTVLERIEKFFIRA